MGTKFSDAGIEGNELAEAEVKLEGEGVGDGIAVTFTELFECVQLDVVVRGDAMDVVKDVRTSNLVNVVDGLIIVESVVSVASGFKQLMNPVWLKLIAFESSEPPEITAWVHATG